MNATKEQEQINVILHGKHPGALNTIKKEDLTRKLSDVECDKSDDERKTKMTEEKFKIELPVEEELLGSVTTLSSPAVRTSARVIQKLKMDLIRPTSPPPPEKKDSNKDDRPLQKTPNQQKASKVIWSNIERNLFFEAINEYGKDFECISHYINSKQKRKNTTDPFYKTKENVRQIYHQTFHKLSKYLRFSDDVKKQAQELYALINYGEMRKKLVFVNQKDCMKLKELVYKGSVTLRVKGKNIRIKTPSCKALRKLNQLEEWQEEIKLPSKVDVFLKPANIAAWATVQNLAQNPRVKTVLPLQKRVVSLLKTLQTRWRSRVARLCEQTMTLNTNMNQNQKQPNNDTKALNDCEIVASIPYSEPLLCFAPTADAIIHRPMVNLSEFLSSYSICLNSYEDRIGVSMKGETLCTERLNTLKEIIKTNAKRQRHDSGSEKKSPDGKRIKPETDIKLITCKIEDTAPKEMPDDFLASCSSSTKCDSAVTSVFGNIQLGVSQIVAQHNSETESSGDENKANVNQHKIANSKIHAIEGCSNLIESECGAEIPLKKEPTMMPEVSTVKPTPENKTKRKEPKCVNNKRKDSRKEPFRTLLSEEVIQQIKKGWTILDIGDLTIGDLYIMFGKDFKVNLIYSWMEPKKEIVTDEISAVEKVETEITTNNVAQNNGSELGNKLKQLLLLANMTEKTKRKINCTCDRGFRIKNKNDTLATSYISSKIYPTSQTDSSVFRQPILPLRGGMSHMEAYRLNMNNARNKQSRWLKMRNSRPSKQVVVQRLLPLQPGISQSYGLVTIQEEYLKNAIRSNDLTEMPVKEPIPKILNCNNNEDETHKTKEANVNGNREAEEEEEEEEVKTEALNKCDTDDISEDSLSDDPGIKSLMELSLPSPVSESNIDFIYNSGAPMSPMGILRESPTDPKWFEDNVNDFSLSSFLGHLDSACTVETNRKAQAHNREVESSNLSNLGETSIDYMTKFVELAQSMKNQD